MRHPTGFVEPETVRAIAADPRSAGLDAVDVAVMEVAEKALDGLGVRPDQDYNRMEPGLRDALTVGRPIAED